MRGAELGLSGQDLMLYQMGEVVQIGVMIERSLDSWIKDAYVDVGAPHDLRKIPIPLKQKVELVCELVTKLSYYTDEEKEWMQQAVSDTRIAMQLRNRVIHDQWVSLGDGNVTRFGYFAESDGFPTTEIEPGIGPGQYSHQDWERLRTLLWHCYWRLSNLPWVRRLPPDFDYFFGHTEEHYAMIRGEFYLGRDYLVPWSWADNPPDFAGDIPNPDASNETSALGPGREDCP